MPSINDIAMIAEALEQSPVAVVADRCIAVRNRNATCRKCVNACSAGAIDVSGNEIRLNSSLCTACGICTVVCPVECLVPLKPDDASLAKSAVSSVSSNSGTCVFACARIASKRLADPASYAEVPCLSRLDESIIVSAVSFGAESIVFVDGDCSTCKYRDNSECFNTTVSLTERLFEAFNIQLPMKRETGFPADLLVEGAHELHGTSRRGFFSEAIGVARDTAMTAAKTSIDHEFGINQEIAPIGNRLRVTEEGTLPLITARRHEAVLNELYDHGVPRGGSLESRLFGAVTVDTRKCNSCGMCIMFCPTAALRRDSATSPRDPLECIEFFASSCIQCSLCVDVCWKHALEMGGEVSIDQLFDFEPVVFNLKSR